MTEEQQKQFEEMCARFCLTEDQQYDLTELVEAMCESARKGE